jgi:tetratricopeptide (TPR) repeat protein
VWLNSAQGMISLASEDVPASQEHYARAYEAARNLPDIFSDRQIVNFGQRHAFSLLRLGQGPEAERAFRPLVERMVRLAGADHPDTLLLRLNLAQSLLVQQRYGEVIDALDPLLPLMEQRLGRDHRITLLLLSARQQALGSAGRYTEAAEDGERVWRAAAQKDGASSFAAVAGRADTGISQCRAGRLAAGSANISAALAALGQDAANRGAMKDAVEAALADCLIQMRRFDEAESLLRGIDRVQVAQLVGDRNFGALVDLALAEIAFGQGDRNRARTLFDAASGPLGDTQDLFVKHRLGALRKALT